MTGQQASRLTASEHAPAPTELDLQVPLCGAIIQLIRMGHRDPELWRRYRDDVLRALSP